MCLKSNGTVHAAWKTFIAEKKALLPIMSYGFENQISAFCDNYIFFACFSVMALSLWPFYENLIKLKIFGFFFLWCEGWASNNNSTWNFLSVLKKLQLKHKSCFKKSMVMSLCQELVFLSGIGGSKREETRWKMIIGVGGHPQAEQKNMFSVWEKRWGAIAILLLEW